MQNIVSKASLRAKLILF